MEPYDTVLIAGETCNVRLSRDRALYREIVIMVGPADRPGMRSKDYGAGALRQEIKARVIEALKSDPMAVWILERQNRIRVQARYSCLSIADNGMIERRNESGRVIAVYEP